MGDCKPRRIIVCGSRKWKDSNTIETVLAREFSSMHDTMVHGSCPTGADNLASMWAAGTVRQERHPANWEKHGRWAGPKRNREMADLGADLCVAFWDGESRGTLDMVRVALEAGIPVHIYGAKP